MVCKWIHVLGQSVHKGKSSVLSSTEYLRKVWIYMGCIFLNAYFGMCVVHTKIHIKKRNYSVPLFSMGICALHKTKKNVKEPLAAKLKALGAK